MSASEGSVYNAIGGCVSFSGTTAENGWALTTITRGGAGIPATITAPLVLPQ